MLEGPVVIGGIGGSGTRVVAEMLSMMGFYIGSDLNNALDNLSYTLLLKRPGWYVKYHGHRGKMARGLKIMEKVMVSGEPFSFRERIFLEKAARDMSRNGHNQEGEGKGTWAFDRLAVIKNSVMPDPSEFTGWGWKEPNTHLLVPAMHAQFKHFKYIHTVRHGLDMAFSQNQQQLFNWAGLFDVPLSGDEKDIPRMSLKYWIKANNRIYRLAEEFGDQAVLVVNFDELCQQPAEGIHKIAGFLGVHLAGDLFGRLETLPAMPSSAGRYKDHPRERFDPEDIAEVEKLGFDCSY